MSGGLTGKKSLSPEQRENSHIELFAECPTAKYKKAMKKPGTRQKRNVFLFEATEREWRLDREEEPIS